MIAQEYCPVNGRYVFTYSVNDGLAGHVNECHEPVSELSNCPYGFGLGLRFKRCSFGDLGRFLYTEPKFQSRRRLQILSSGPLFLSKILFVSFRFL